MSQNEIKVDAKIVGNVLILGNSGAGKSTIINAMLGEEVAKTGKDIKGVTPKLVKYGPNRNCPFRLWDTRGFEPKKFMDNIFGSKIARDIKKQLEDNAKDESDNQNVHVVWFCIDGTSPRIFEDTITDFLKAISIFKDVPIITVITKSYSRKEIAENRENVNHAFEKLGRADLGAHIIPVVAKEFFIDDEISVPPFGIDELREKTLALIPMGIEAARNAVADFNLKTRRTVAQSCVTTAVIAAGGIGFAPLPFADAPALGGIEAALIHGIAYAYDIRDLDKQAKLLKDTILEVGTVGVAAKGLIGAIKAVPGIGLPAAAINCVMAAGIVLAIGQGAIEAFEKVFLGKLTLNDVDVIKAILEKKFAQTGIDKLNAVIQNIRPDMKAAEIVKIILDMVQP